MRYFLRTETNCGVGLGDDQRYVEMNTLLDLDDDDPKWARVADDLAASSHGWVETDIEGTPIERPPAPPPWTPPEGSLHDPLDEAPTGALDPPVDSPTT